MYIENYCKSIRNLAKYGVKVIVYNFMPVLDWLRTDLARVIPEDAPTACITTGRAGRDGDRPPHGRKLQRLHPAGLGPARLAELGHVLELYKSVDEEKLFENFKVFPRRHHPDLREEVGVKMACHPDDQAGRFSACRASHDQAGFDRMVKLHDSPCNTLCLCTGSLGSNVRTISRRWFAISADEPHRLPACAQHQASGQRPPLPRAASRNPPTAVWICTIMKRPRMRPARIPTSARLRPHDLGLRSAAPATASYDRALGIAYLNGLWEAIDKNAKRG